MNWGVFRGRTFDYEGKGLANFVGTEHLFKKLPSEILNPKNQQSILALPDDFVLTFFAIESVQRSATAIPNHFYWHS